MFSAIIACAVPQDGDVYHHSALVRCRHNIMHAHACAHHNLASFFFFIWILAVSFSFLQKKRITSEYRDEAYLLQRTLVIIDTDCLSLLFGLTCVRLLLIIT